MKKVLSSILALAMMLSLVACGKQATPESIIDETLKSIQSLDRDSILELYNLEEDVDGLLADEDVDQVMEIMELLLSKMTYTMGESTVDEENGTAVVSVTITNTDMSDVIERFMNAALEYGLKYAFLPADQQPSDEEVNEALYAKLKELLASPDNKTVTITVDVPMALEDGEWVVTDEILFSDAVYGGLLTAIEEMNAKLDAMQ